MRNVYSTDIESIYNHLQVCQNKKKNKWYVKKQCTIFINSMIRNVEKQKQAYENIFQQKKLFLRIQVKSDETS